MFIESSKVENSLIYFLEKKNLNSGHDSSMSEIPNMLGS